MGQAKQRGTYEERRAKAVTRREEKRKNEPPQPPANPKMRKESWMLLTLGQIFGVDIPNTPKQG